MPAIEPPSSSALFFGQCLSSECCPPVVSAARSLVWNPVANGVMDFLVYLLPQLNLRPSPRKRWVVEVQDDIRIPESNFALVSIADGDASITSSHFYRNVAEALMYFALDIVACSISKLKKSFSCKRRFLPDRSGARAPLLINYGLDRGPGNGPKLIFEVCPKPLDTTTGFKTQIKIPVLGHDGRDRDLAIFFHGLDAEQNLEAFKKELRSVTKSDRIKSVPPLQPLRYSKSNSLLVNENSTAASSSERSHYNQILRANLIEDSISPNCSQSLVCHVECPRTAELPSVDQIEMPNDIIAKLAMNDVKQIEGFQSEVEEQRSSLNNSERINLVESSNVINYKRESSFCIDGIDTKIKQRKLNSEISQNGNGDLFFKFNNDANLQRHQNVLPELPRKPPGNTISCRSKSQTLRSQGRASPPHLPYVKEAVKHEQDVMNETVKPVGVVCSMGVGAASYILRNKKESIRKANSVASEESNFSYSSILRSISLTGHLGRSLKSQCSRQDIPYVPRKPLNGSIASFTPGHRSGQELIARLYRPLGQKAQDVLVDEWERRDREEHEELLLDIMHNQRLNSLHQEENTLDVD